MHQMKDVFTVTAFDESVMDLLDGVVTARFKRLNSDLRSRLEETMTQVNTFFEASRTN
jgi:hypothetical protein